VRNYDTLQRFLFEEVGVRGEIVRLNATWQAILSCHEYPQAVREHLGQALAATLLLVAPLKFSGSLILQLQGNGSLHTLVAQATHCGTVRGLARWEGAVPCGELHEVLGDGRLALTLQGETSEPHQGVVPLTGATLAEALEDYFRRSEQLATRLWLVADSMYAAGLFLQQLPGQSDLGDDWERLTVLADTVTRTELFKVPNSELLYRLFNEERVRLFEPEPVAFRCSCSRARIEETLLLLGTEELKRLSAEQEVLVVTCEFCNRSYGFDQVDVERLRNAGPGFATPPTRH